MMQLIYNVKFFSFFPQIIVIGKLTLYLKIFLNKQIFLTHFIFTYFKI